MRDVLNTCLYVEKYHMINRFCKVGYVQPQFLKIYCIKHVLRIVSLTYPMKMIQLVQSSFVGNYAINTKNLFAFINN